jgi:GNAT superfamily N-acetyltransferase
MAKITSTVKVDAISAEIGKIFDYEFEGKTTFELHTKPTIRDTFNIGLIVGASGSGKSLLLEDFGEDEEIKWDSKLSVASHFSSAAEAIDKLTSVGLNSIPSWLKPFHVLSNGEKYRADLSRKLKSGCVIDEFTSVVDRNVAKSCAFAIQKYIRKQGLTSVVFASCHFDIIDWLQPDWVYNTDTRKMKRRLPQPVPKIELDILSCDSFLWEMFKSHHYLTSALNKAARCFALKFEENIIGFIAVLPLPSGTVKNAFRSHRTVILPDYQGMGLGVKFGNAVAQLYINAGCRYYSRVTHPKLGAHRNKSPLWRATTSNMSACVVNAGALESTWKTDVERICFSHEYIAPPTNNINVFAKEKKKGFIDL